MNKTKLFSFALAGLMLGACSNDDVVDNGSNLKDAFGKDGKAYVNLAITLPTAQGTRANGNGNFQDGDADEYAVDNAALVIFSGTEETDATLASAYKLSPNFVKDPSTNQVTSTAKIVQFINQENINKDEETSYLYAYVILNYEGTEFSVDDTDNTLSYNGEVLPATTKFTDFQKLTVKELQANGKAFLMANAPVSYTPGGSLAPKAPTTTLSAIDAKNLYLTAEEARRNPATEVFVERVAAKVTVTGENGNLTGNIDSDLQLPYEISGWIIDNYNPTSYVNRNVAATPAWLAYASEQVRSNQYRFVDADEIRSGVYRTYWGEDMNYAESGVGTLVTLAGQYPTTDGFANLWNGVGTNAYCHENTFNVANQNWDQTTRVVVAATFNNGEDFYTIDKEGADVIYTKEEATNYIADKVVNYADVQPWLDKMGEALLAAGRIQNGETVDLDLKVELVDATGDDLKDGEVFANVTLGAKRSADGSTLETSDLLDTETAQLKKDIEAFLQNYYNVYWHKNGLAYYSVRIKHFGDYLTPWEATVGMNDTNASVYGTGVTAEQNYLGRYGVVRNNWYQINVTGIKHIGSATVPGLDTTPDDTPDPGYISVQINILPWAVRTQDVEL